MASQPLERSATSEAILAWRAWRLTGGQDPSTYRLSPMAGHGYPWPPMAPVRAACRKIRRHPAPHPACRCGLYAWRLPTPLHKSGESAVIGTVALWGRVIEHLHGYRSQFAYPQRIQLVCWSCLWWHGSARATPDVVARLGRHALVPVCWAHLEGFEAIELRPRDLLSATEVEAGLRSVYAVDVLRMELRPSPRDAMAGA